MEKITISHLIEKKYNYNTYFQRDKAWTPKIKTCFVDSIMNGFYIPPVLVANNQVIDGKQRITTIEDFKKNSFFWTNSNDGIKRKYDDLNWNEQKTFNEFEIYVVDLGNIDNNLIRETFIRINEGSVKLNKVELRLAKANEENRKLIFKIAKNENINNISNRKKNDKRFKIEELIIRCLTILNMPGDKKNVRNQMEKFLTSKLDDCEKIYKDSTSTIDYMYKILNNDTIPIAAFNTVFESIFCSMYKFNNSKNSFLENKNEIKQKIIQKIDEISSDQMGGGIKFDSMDYISKRIGKIDTILESYLVDKKRLYSYDEKLIIWRTRDHVCDICKKQINDINDFEPDHVVAHTQGGRTVLENARILCRTCNRQEGVKVKNKYK